MCSILRVLTLPLRGRSLIELDLKCNYLTSTSLAHILSSLPDCPCLQGLALGDNPLGSEAGGILGAAISTSCASLQKLGLGGTNLGDVGVLALAPCLAAHGALKVVGLSANGVSVKGARELMEVLKGSQTIDTVVLGGNAFSQADAVMLQDMCRSGMSLKMA